MPPSGGWVRGGRPARLLVALIALTFTMAAAAGAARADDLLVLNGDSETLSGASSYGLVYIDGELNLTGDTSITANSIYIGPDANINSCFVAGSGNSACTAGRSLTLSASGPLTVADNIDLTAGSGSYRPGGNLTLSGGPVVVGNVNTSGSDGAPSGDVSLTSSGTLAAGGIYAPGAAVGLDAAGSIDVGGAVQTEGSGSVASTPGSAQSAGAVAINSTGGDVRIDGNVQAYGLNASTASDLNGGNGAGVTILGTNIRTGAIQTTGGTSGAASPGSSAPITIRAGGSLQALGQLDASGQNGPNELATPGQPITLSAGGALTIGGEVYANGGQGQPGAAITLSGSPVTTDDLFADGGSGPYNATTAAGGNGASININAPSGASLGSLLAYGGNSEGAASPGTGGTIAVSSPAGSIATGSVQTQGGYPADGAGVDGGGITLSAGGSLSVGGQLDADGSGAGGSTQPAADGGNAGNVALRANTGILTLGGNASAAGGNGGYPSPNTALGGTGGTGGKIVIVAPTIGAIASLISQGGDGGNYGQDQGTGGAGGTILAFTNSPLFNDKQLVSSDGGDGNPTGAAGAMDQDSSPSGLAVVAATGRLSFTSSSPDAQGYRILMSVAGGPPTTALTTTATSDLHPNAPLCVPVSFTAEAFDNTYGWTSAPSSAVSYERPPSTSQSCSAAPHITGAVTKRTLHQLSQAGWVAAVTVKSNGIGELEASLKAKGAPAVTLSVKLTKPGSRVLRFRIPTTARTAGKDTVALTATSPDGKHRLKTTLTLEIVK